MLVTVTSAIGSIAAIDILEDVGGTASSLNTLLLSLGQLEDVAVHGVL